MIEKCGFEAIQVSGYGVAGSLLGKPDVGLVQMKDVLDVTWNIAQAVDIPVMADVDTGGGNAVNAAWITERLIAMGVAGMNIEDQVFPKRCGHMAGKEVIDADEMAGKVRACADVRDRLDPDFIINARTDVVRGARASTRPSAAATCIWRPAPTWPSSTASRRGPTWSGRSRRSKGPLSVNLMDAISGMKTELIPIPELAAMGVGRVSIPVASIMVAHKALDGVLHRAQGVAHRDPARTDAVGELVRGIHRLRRARRTTRRWRTSTCPGSAWRASTATLTEDRRADA